MIRELHVSLFDLIISSSQAFELLNPDISNHQLQVAYIAYAIGTEMELTSEQKHNLLLAGALHDIGAFSLKERLQIKNFDYVDEHNHTEFGYYVLKMFKPFSKVAEIVRDHHCVWKHSVGVGLESQIIHLADRVAILLNIKEYTLPQAENIRKKIQQFSGTTFNPKIVNAFMHLSQKEYFWFDIASPSLSILLKQRIPLNIVELNSDELLDFSHMIKVLIDFRSEHTATHSSRVALTAKQLADFIGFSKRESQFMEIAGNLHDFGKIAIPLEILNKPEKLTTKEFDIMRSHAYYTYTILEPISELNLITTWAAFHHERLDGNGYPFHHNAHNLTLGSRIMAVADIFATVVEDRVYRKGFDRDKILKILHSAANNYSIDADIANVIEKNFDLFHSLCLNADKSALEEYNKFISFKQNTQHIST